MTKKNTTNWKRWKLKERKILRIPGLKPMNFEYKLISDKEICLKQEKIVNSNIKGV